MEHYIPRLVDSTVDLYLRTFGAVLIAGPKWCGKTTTAENHCRSVIRMQDPDNSERYIQVARNKPSLLLEGEKPRLIDEWQVEPRVWDAVRYSVDENRTPGQYILTGSVTPVDDGKRHSGVGRIIRLEMRNLSLFESGDSTGEVSLRGLMDGIKDVSGTSPLDYSSMAGVLVRGGWPASIGANPDLHRGIVQGYCEGLLETDINLPDGKKRNKQRMRAILRSLSRNIATEAPNTTVLDDVSNTYDGGLSINTLADYISALKDIYVVEDLEAWSPRLRSKTAIRTSDVRHFSDPAIAAYFLGAGPRDLEMDPRTYGLLFESLVIRDLRVYARCNGGDVYHYRDADNLEVDAVIHLHDGRWGAVEVKLGEDGIETGSKNLLRLSRKVDEDKMNPPSFLAVVTSSGYAYTRSDGVHVIPLGCLRD